MSILTQYIDHSMKTLSKILIVVFIGLAFNTCGDYGEYGNTHGSPIIISNIEHHVGLNPGAEGRAVSSEFEMSSEFSYAEITITLPYPNSKGTNAWTSEFPPEFKINGNVIGIFPTQLTPYQNCIDEYADFICPFTFTYDITSLVSGGTNVFYARIGGGYGNPEDFVFSDVYVHFQ